MARVAWVPYGVVAVAHLVFQAVDPGLVGARITQVLLAPVLIGMLLVTTRPPRGRTVLWAVAGLVFCCLGDLLPGVTPESVSFLTMVGAFWAAQICFCVAFWPMRGRSFLNRQRGWLGGYVGVLVGMLMLIVPDAGALVVPVVGYGITLTTMAVLASGLGRAGAVGGALFFVSDGLIAVTSFRASFPGSGLLIMATYELALALLVVALDASPSDRGSREPFTPNRFPG